MAGGGGGGGGISIFAESISIDFLFSCDAVIVPTFPFLPTAFVVVTLHFRTEAASSSVSVTVGKGSKFASI